MTLQTQTGEAAAALQCQLEGAEASHSLHAKLAPVPDLDNRRFCRACATTLPVGAFPPGKRRYLCKRHVWLRVKKPSKERALGDPLRPAPAARRPALEARLGRREDGLRTPPRGAAAG